MVLELLILQELVATAVQVLMDSAAEAAGEVETVLMAQQALEVLVVELVEMVGQAQSLELPIQAAVAVAEEGQMAPL